MDVEQALKLKANKKLLKVHIQEQTGKHVTLRDISNMDAKLKRNNDHDQSDLVKTIQRLKDINGQHIMLCCTEQGACFYTHKHACGILYFLVVHVLAIFLSTLRSYLYIAFYVVECLIVWARTASIS